MTKIQSAITAVLSLVFFTGASSYQLKPITPSQALKWTAFKYTSKAPVNGTFNTISHNITAPATSITQLLSEAEFSINTTSLSTGDVGRDANINSNFFNLIDKHTTIKGKVISIKGNDESGTVRIKLTFARTSAPIVTLKYVVTPNASNPNELMFTATGTLDLLAQGGRPLKSAHKALHKACLTLHTGPDGVSKTWSTVDLKVELPILRQ